MTQYNPTQLFNHYEPHLKALSQRLNLPTKDALQSAFAKLCEVWPAVSTNPRIKDLRAYCWKVVSSCLYSLARKSKRSKHEISVDETILNNVQDDSQTSEQAYLISEQGVALQNAVMSLPDTLKRIIELRYMEGWTQSEVARELGVSLATVQRREREALELIRAMV